MSRSDRAGGDGGLRPYLLVTLVFVALAAGLAAIMATYWESVLEARLVAEARNQAEVLARSQAAQLATALRSGSPTERRRALDATLDELLLLRDPETETPFFESIELEIDADTVPGDTASLDLRRGESAGLGGFRTEVAVYDPETFELLAIARFRVSDRFSRQLNSDVRRGLVGVTLAVLALLVLVWAALILLLRRSRRQEARRLRAELALVQQEQKYQRLVDSLSTYFVYGKDADGRLERVSDSVRRVLGYAPGEVLERLGGRLAGLPDSEAGAEVGYEVELEDRDGRIRHLELSEVAVFGSSGVEAVDGIARDVTAQRQVQQELRAAKEQAEQANRAKSQFLANVSHEIRTPLNAILGMATLVAKTELGVKQRSYVDKITASGRLLHEIIEDILDLSKIEAGRVRVERAAFDLDELLGELADVVGPKAAEKQLEVLFDVAPDVPRALRGDPLRLKQVLLNLLNNAIKFTERGEVVVAIAPLERRHERVALQVAVRDTGVGIPREHLPTLFDPFTQVDASATRRFGGVGLGLAISRRLVQMMGGELTVDSAPGEGSTFSFNVPFGVTSATPARQLAAELRGLRVLVVDDNASARTVLSQMLESLSFEVSAVGSGKEAVVEVESARAVDDPYRLVLMDWRMPGLDGTETARRLGVGPRGGPILPVVMITAFDQDQAARDAAEVGIEIVLPKPVSPSTLHDAVLQALVPGADRAPARPGPAKLRFSPGQHVLVVEDNAINREVARELLWAAGLEVSEAHDGREALERLATGSYDAVLMDVQMPEMDGIEAVRKLREAPGLEDLPVFAMTAHAMLGDRERFLEAGMTGYVPKPIDESELLGMLARYLGTEPPEPIEPPEPTGPVARGPDDGSAAAIPASRAEIPGFDVADGLRRVRGNRALYARLATQLVEDNGQLVDEVRAMIAGGDREGALARLHLVKGAAASLSAKVVAAASARAEVVVQRAGDPEPALEALAVALEQAREALPGLAVGDVAGPGEARDTTVAPQRLDSVLELVGRLRPLLAENDLAATRVFEELRRLLDGAHTDRSGPLGECLDDLDFEAAARRLDELESSLRTDVVGRWT